MISHENKHFALEHLTPMITSQNNLIISRSESLPMSRLRKRLNHKDHYEHKEGKQLDAASWCPSWLKNALVNRT
jgi:hypothetical protein